MRIINGLHNDNITIETNTRVSGMINGNVEVLEGVMFQVDGMVNGNIKINNESSFQLNGMVNGNVELYKGTAEINGSVKGNIINDQGIYTISDEALISGVIKG